MVFSVTEFLETPTVEEFELLKKDDLIGLGLHFKLAVKSSMRKQEIKVIVAKRLVQEEIFSSYDFPEENVSSETKMSQYEFELAKMRLQLEFEKEEKIMQKRRTYATGTNRKRRTYATGTNTSRKRGTYAQGKA